MKGRALGVVDGVAARGGPGPVVVPDAAEGAEPDGRRLPAAVERRPHRVQVYEQVRVDDGAVHLHVEPPVGVAEVHELVGVLRVVAVEVVVAEREDELAAQERLHLDARQLAVEPLGAEQGDVAQVDAEARQLLDYELDCDLPEVGAPGLEVGARRIVECDGHLGLRPSQLAQRLVRYRALDGVAHRLADVGHRRHRRFGVDHPGALGQPNRQAPVPVRYTFSPRLCHTSRLPRTVYIARWTFAEPGS